jgi:CheY-like chemotaxis protein
VIDDSDHLQASDRILLIIEDDRNFLRTLIDLAHERDFKCVVAEDGKTGLQFATDYKPDAIILDVGLPEIDGWTVMEKLKDNPDTRHVPVHFISAFDHDKDAKQMGAIGCLLKPVGMAELSEAFRKIEHFIDTTIRTLLVVVDQAPRRQQILNLIGNSEVKSVFATTHTEAYHHLQQQTCDCIILDVDCEQGASLQLLEQLCREERLSQIPIVIYAERELTVTEETLLHQCEAKLTIKSAHSPERLLDETTLFLHQLETNLPKEKQKMLQRVHDKQAILTGKRVLIVDDDVRNTFALMTFLDSQNMTVVVANQGKEALLLLTEHPDIDMVLMDIMMPEMDGYETMRRIRSQSQFRHLPIIALTAKAMKGDKAKCIEAGANDYLTKPLDTDKLVYLLRVWLYR